MKKLAGIFMFIFMLNFLTGTAFAEPTVQELQTNMEKLMHQIGEMETAIKAQKDQIEALQKKIAELSSKETSLVAQAAQEVKTSSKYKVNFYGQIKMDAVYDTNDLGKDEFITYIPKTANGTDKTTFNMRDTRFGIAIDGPSLGGWEARGRFETDFYGTDLNDSSNGALRIRLSYIDFKKGNTLIRVGQDWTKIASLNPTNLDFGIMSFNGNLWNRVPQITIEQKLGGGFEGLLSIYRFRWKDDEDVSGLRTQLRMPWIGTRLAYSGTLFDREKNAYIGLGGAIRNGKANDNQVTPYLVALEWQIPYKIFELRGESYIGKGIGTEYYHKGGAFNSSGEEIKIKGGFVQLNVKPFKDLQFTVGYGLDDPRDSDVGNNFYQKSQYTFGNVYLQLMKDIIAGFQVSNIETDWVNGTKYGTRYMSSLIYQW